MTLIGKIWTVEMFQVELVDLEKQKDTIVLQITQRHKEDRNEEVQEIRRTYRLQRKKLLAALDVLLAEEGVAVKPAED